MGKHIAGNPSIIVENMAEAASLISANYVYKAAKPDGLTIGHFIGGRRSPCASGRARPAACKSCRDTKVPPIFASRAESGEVAF